MLPIGASIASDDNWREVTGAPVLLQRVGARPPPCQGEPDSALTPCFNSCMWELMRWRWGSGSSPAGRVSSQLKAAAAPPAGGYIAPMVPKSLWFHGGPLQPPDCSYTINLNVDREDCDLRTSGS